MTPGAHKTPRIIACVHHGLGDLLMALPTLVALDRAAPSSARLTILVKGVTEASVIRAVMWQHPVEIITVVPVGGIGRFTHTIRVALALRRAEPDIFLAIHGSDTFVAAAFSRLVGAKLAVGMGARWGRFGYDQLREADSGVHKVQHYADIARAALPLANLPEQIPLQIPKQAVDQVAKLLPSGRAWLLIAPGSGPEECHKRWPPEYYSKLVDRIRSVHPKASVAIIGNPAERNLLAAINANCRSGEITRLEDLDILAALEAIRRAHCVITSCNGASHMAATMGTPIIGIFGPTNPGFTGPYTTKLRIVRCDYQCSPCYRLGFERGCGRPVCMTDILPEMVLRELSAELHEEIRSPMPLIRTSHARAPDTRLAQK